MNHPLFDKLQELADQHDFEPFMGHDLEPPAPPKLASQAKPKAKFPALPEFTVLCSLSGKRVLKDEAELSAVSGRLADVRNLI